MSASCQSVSALVISILLSVSPLLKKSTLDKDDLCNYRPISLNLSLLSKIIECIVMYCVTSLFKYRLTSHLSCNNLCNPPQSALCKYHSTETAPLYTHDHLVNAIGSQQACLCLLDLSVAFALPTPPYLPFVFLLWYLWHCC